MRRAILSGLVLLYGLSADILSETIIPCRIQVQPVFFVPQGEAEPTKEEQLKLKKHIKLTQLCYQKMLNRKDAFDVSEKNIPIHRSQHPLDYYKREDSKGISLLPVRELFEAYGYNRFTCPYVYVIVFMNSKEDFPAGGGRPFNRGFNNGGGLVYLSSYGLNYNQHFQSTLLHELGHSFGLVHVDAYGYDMKTNPSIMSYNLDNWWDGFKVKKRAGDLIPEDLRALNYNKRVFPDFHFDSAMDIPKGYKISRLVVLLAPPDDIPDEKPFAVVAQSDCPELLDSQTQNVVHKQILSANLSKTEKDIKGFDADSMWMTKASSSSWGTLDIRFPVEVMLTKICLHSGCGGGLYPLRRIKLYAVQNGKETLIVPETTVAGPDRFVSFQSCSTDHLRLFFQGDDEGTIIFRGIRFFSKDCEIFCPDYPIFD